MAVPRRLHSGISVALTLTLALAAMGLGSGCSREVATTIDLTGRVVDETVVLPAPVIVTAAPDIEAGFETSAAVVSPGKSTSSARNWIRVASVNVVLGQSVKQGDVIAVVATASLDAALAAASADEAVAQSNVKAIDDKAGNLVTTASDVASKTAELNKTIAELTLQRADLQVKLSIAEAAAGSLGATATVPAGQTDPRVQVKLLEAAIAKIDAALVKAQQAVVDLATAQTEIATAQSAIQYTRDAAAAVAEGYAVATRLAQADLGRAQVLAPFDAVVVGVAATGEVLAGGAPIAALRPVQGSRIETYVTDEGRQALSVGIQVGALADSQPARGYTGRVRAIENEYEYVPTWFSTKVIHMTRAFRVEIELDQGQTLPAGTPVDVSISVN